MSGFDHSFIYCEEDGCDSKIKNHYWSKVKSEGWCHLKDDRSYCPDHVPDWYAKWKKRR